MHWIFCRSSFDLRFQDLAKLIRGKVPANIDEKARNKHEDILVATLNIQDKGDFLWDRCIISSIYPKNPGVGGESSYRSGQEIACHFWMGQVFNIQYSWVFCPNPLLCGINFFFSNDKNLRSKFCFLHFYHRKLRMLL